jgi:signal transduction histidine kinase
MRTLDLEVVDDGAAKTDPAAVGGQGIIGIRERVAMWKGTVDIGQRQEGGFRVHAQLPYSASEP